MNGFKHAALAGAFALAAGVGPVATAHAQSGDALVRAFDIGRPSRIGVSVQDLDESAAKDATHATQGVMVEAVEPGGPADKAGVKSGDAIVEFDGERVRSARQFSRLVQETPPGSSVAVALSRGGQRSTVNVTVERGSLGDDFAMRLLESPRMARPPLPPAPPASPRPPAAAPMAPFETFRFSSGRRLGATIETLDDQLAQYFGVKEGVLVRSVEADSTAQRAGLKAGDVITAVNGRQVYEASDVARALDRVDADAEVSIDIVRDRKPQTLKGKLETRRNRGATWTF